MYNPEMTSEIMHRGRDVAPDGAVVQDASDGATADVQGGAGTAAADGAVVAGMAAADGAAAAGAQLMADGAEKAAVKPDQMSKGGKKKTRLVACGNSSGREDAQDLFASGAAAVALRAALTVAAQFGFEGSVMDVRIAFLNAPMVLSSAKGENGEKLEPKRAIIRPPARARPDEFYEGPHGYKESPRLWSDYRDQGLATMEFPCEGGILTLQQMITEPNMWRMMLKKPGPIRETAAEEFVGLLYSVTSGVY